MTGRELAAWTNEGRTLNAGHGARLLRNTNGGTLTAPAAVVHRGSITIMVDALGTEGQDRRIVRAPGR